MNPLTLLARALDALLPEAAKDWLANSLYVFPDGTAFDSRELYDDTEE